MASRSSASCAADDVSSFCAGASWYFHARPASLVQRWSRSMREVELAAMMGSSVATGRAPAHSRAARRVVGLFDVGGGLRRHHCRTREQQHVVRARAGFEPHALQPGESALEVLALVADFQHENTALAHPWRKVAKQPADEVHAIL